MTHVTGATVGKSCRASSVLQRGAVFNPPGGQERSQGPRGHVHGLSCCTFCGSWTGSQGAQALGYTFLSASVRAFPQSLTLELGVHLQNKAACPPQCGWSSVCRRKAWDTGFCPWAGIMPTAPESQAWGLGLDRTLQGPGSPACTADVRATQPP